MRAQDDSLSHNLGLVMATSRREFLTAGAAATLAAIIGRPRILGAWQGQQQQATPVFTPIRRNVGFFTMRGGTIGYLVNAGGVCVVDSQFPAEAKACLDGLQQQSGNRGVDFLINTHHHGDHTGGNISFKGVAKKVVAHTMAAEHMRNVPGAPPPAAGVAPVPENLFPDTTFKEKWKTDIGDEKIEARHYGRAHTSGDAVIVFERANVAHMGDLMFNKRHPVVDRAAGATLKNWMKVLEKTSKDLEKDTVYIFGHANTGLPVTGTREDLLGFRDYFGALLAFVETQVKAGKSREEVIAMREPLKGFEAYGRFANLPAQPPAPGRSRDALICAYEEVTTKS